MSIFELLARVKTYSVHSWQQYLLNTVLATAGVLALTYIISAFQLYPRIPNNVSVIVSWEDNHCQNIRRVPASD